MAPPSMGRSGREEEAISSRLRSLPGEGAAAGLVHHGGRALLLLALAFAVSFLLPQPRGERVANYQAGVVAEADIIASLTFGVPKNTAELEREREAAAAGAPPTFRFDLEAVPRMTQAIGDYFASIAEVERANNPDQVLERFLDGLGLQLSQEQRSLLRDGSMRSLLSGTALRAVQDILPLGVLDEGARLEPDTPGRILIQGPNGLERIELQSDVLTSRDFFERAAQLLPPSAGPAANELLRLTLIRFLDPTLRFERTATEADREAARGAVGTVRGTVLQGEAVVRANQQIGEAELERLRAYAEALRSQGELENAGVDFASLLAGVVLNLVILGVFATLLFLYGRPVYANFRWLLLLGFLVVAFVGAAGVIARNDALPMESLPIAFVALATAVLWDGRLALALVATLAALTGAQLPFQDVHAWLPLFIGGSAAALSVRAVRRRAQTWVFAAIIAAAYAVAILTLTAVTDRDPSGLLTSLSWSTGNAVVSAILAMGFLPVFEWFTRITTDQTLLEWADPNRPLLKKLSMEAPGTYAHTINVANLAEAAANAIGASGLLCRVGVYYHDVGKMLKSHYFIENQPSGRNPHDKLKPATSAAIVREHVTEGIRMAREANLPEVLVSFIPEHHGTQEIAFFYDRARKEAGPEEEVDPEEYRYPGPKPQSRETAISMLSDSVESAARTLQDPTPERMWDLIDSIVDDKIRQGQLDECPLTLREIGRIKEQFLKVMTGVYHQRIDYPATRHLTELPGTTPVATEEGGVEAQEGGGPP